ncbi:MAG: undecaprenyldiphospho-muramoylpentapeptide beta-N-acetylglucosaminyltransferase [Candidatus Paraimprobicoccus trichonymphae]|uniref:UDP-N-acetylglucosamine--N-acetylmuramyl-(pentapeptide) pyrophosphoryl-undecaprenol N-acetylglucosamine transferase n=1 Tax=Candidatus Paraimprobicoccus trichonymphae TaxID=3033793 RepID=A0AA48I283_9FIRM|nr:MAG: undecaprenyldiphospho-muramoylpentapeptide beta-N-acetylglucosaminyltransferase [Candidatus Paraimprobicoccus trichonymphae]
MKIIFVGGGTAGHINPALAIACYLRERKPNIDILYIGAKNSMEEVLVPKENFDIKTINISGFYRKLDFNFIKKNLITLKNIIIASKESQKIIEDFKPDICIGTGGYVCGPFLREAYKKKIKFILHEQNSYPGITTKLLSKKADIVMLSTHMAKNYLNKNVKSIVVGNPVRSNIGKIDSLTAKKELNFNNDKPVILSFGGSLGSSAINNVMAEFILNNNKTKNYNLIHGYGKYGKWLESFVIKKELNKSNLILKEYINNISLYLSAADLVICRAGAITLSELKICKKPSILIPSPNVAENHQYYNALEMNNSKISEMILEKDLAYEVLMKKVEYLLKNINKIRKNFEKLKISTSEEVNYKIYNIISDLLKH